MPDQIPLLASAAGHNNGTERDIDKYTQHVVRILAVENGRGKKLGDFDNYQPLQLASGDDLVRAPAQQFFGEGNADGFGVIWGAAAPIA